MSATSRFFAPAGGVLYQGRNAFLRRKKNCPKKSVQNKSRGGQFEMCKLVKYSILKDKEVKMKMKSMKSENE
jgi:hypothetical protein